jgi:excisionase family DNA binding protein
MRLLQTQDVAQRLGVATSTIRRWAAEGLLPFRWAGSYRVFELDEVRRLARKLTERIESAK